MKGQVPIRTMVFGAIITMAFLYAIIGFVGSYQLSNNITMNAILKTQYEAVLGNSSNQGIFGSLNNLTKSGQTQAGSIGGVSSINSVGTVAQFLQSIPAVYTVTANLIMGTLEGLLGVGLSYEVNNLLFLVIIIIVIAILSAIFLFPIVYMSSDKDEEIK